MENSKENGIQITVVNISYGKPISVKNKNRPEMAILDLPETIVKLKNDENKFFDNIESFAYNTLTKKYGAEVNHCQIYLP